MKYSAIITTYNGARYTTECLSSLYAHVPTTVEFECIVINDGSTDNTASLLEILKTKYHNLVIISHTENKGPIVRRNEGIRIAKGEYLLFLDNDTVWTGNVFFLLEEKIKSLPRAGIVGMCGIFLPDMNNSYHIHASLIENDLTVQAVPSYCMMVSRRVIQGHVLFDEKMHFMQHEDIDFCLQSLEKGYKIYAIAHVPLIHREHGTFNHYKDTYQTDFEQNWQYLIKKWSMNKMFPQKITLPLLNYKASKKIDRACFYDLFK